MPPELVDGPVFPMVFRVETGESTLKEKTGVKPRRRICDQTDTPPTASAEELAPNVLGFLSFGAYQQRREGDPDAWVTQVLHIEDTPASPHGVDTTREAAVTGYKPYCLIGVEQGARGLLSTVIEILGSHWTATARLKLGR